MTFTHKVSQNVPKMTVFLDLRHLQLPHQSLRYMKSAYRFRIYQFRSTWIKLSEFEKTTKYKTTIFASGIDVIHEFFQLEKKLPLKVSKKIFDIFNSNKLLSKYTKKIANEGLNF